MYAPRAQVNNFAVQSCEEHDPPVHSPFPVRCYLTEFVSITDGDSFEYDKVVFGWRVAQAFSARFLEMMK